MSESELRTTQQQLDPSSSGKIARDRFLSWVTNRCTEQQVLPRAQIEQQPLDESNQRSAEERTATVEEVRAVQPITQVSSASLSTTSKAAAAASPIKKEVCSHSGGNSSVDRHPPSQPPAAVRASASATEITTVDWNGEFETLLEQSPDKGSDTGQLEIGIAAASLLRRFRDAAERLVCEIVAELPLSAKLKRVPELPLDETGQLFVSDTISNDSRSLPHTAAIQAKRFCAYGLLVYLVVPEHTMPTTKKRTPSQAATPSNGFHTAVIHKRLSHQLRAARAVQDAIQRRSSECASLRVPLQCTVDHLGFRCIVFASSLSRLDQNIMRAVSSKDATHCCLQLQIVFKELGLMVDSLDGGADTPSDDENNLPSFVPKSMQWLSRYRARSQILQLCSVYDVFPADTSSAAASDPTALSSESALCKLRPEFVAQCGAMLPLHSNAHLPADVERDDGAELSHTERRRLLEAQLLQQAALSASQFLQCEVVPTFVRSLEENPRLVARVIDSRSLVTAMHQRGINMRYLGLCFSLATAKHVQRLLLAEMVARVCKAALRAAVRDAVRESGAEVMRRVATPVPHTPVEQSDDDGEATDEDQDRYITAESSAEDNDNVSQKKFDAGESDSTRMFSRAMMHSATRNVAVEFFNLVLGATSADAKVFWRDHLLPRVRLKFGVVDTALQSLETLLSDDLLHLPQLFQSLQSCVDVAFDDRTSYNFKSAEPFRVTDLLSSQHTPSPRTKLVARTTTECADLLDAIDDFAASEQLEMALVATKVHIAILDTAPHDERSLPLSQLLAAAAELSFQLNLNDDAERFATLAIESAQRNDAQSARAHLVCMKLKSIEEVRDHYTRAIEVVLWHLGSPHPLLFEAHQTMMELLSERGELRDAASVATSCVDMARECFGKTSIVYADSRRRQGELFYVTGDRFDEAVGVLEDAINVYERYFGDESLSADASVTIAASSKLAAASSCYLIATICAETSEAKSDAEKAYAAARRALALRREVLPADSTDILSSLLQLGALARELGDRFRALEHLKPALVLLKQRADEDQAIEQIPFVTQAVLQLQLQSLSKEQAGVVERTRSRFASLLVTLATSSSTPLLRTSESEDTARQSDEERVTHDYRVETELLAVVMRRLLADEECEYLGVLVEKTDQELQNYRKQYAVNLSSAMRQESAAEEPSPYRKRLQSQSALGSRFASFSGVAGSSCSSPPGSPSLAAPSAHWITAPQSPLASLSSSPAKSAFAPLESPIAGSPTNRERRQSFSQLQCNFLTTPSGSEFTFGAQLAALLFLAG